VSDSVSLKNMKINMHYEYGRFPVLQTEFNVLAIDIEPVTRIVWGDQDEDVIFLTCVKSISCANCGKAFPC
jgi:hypothetical protein